MGVKEDSRKLKSYVGLYKIVWSYHINDAHFSNTTKNIFTSLFEPYSSHLKQKFYRLNDEEIKIVTDILDMMED